MCISLQSVISICLRECFNINTSLNNTLINKYTILYVAFNRKQRCESEFNLFNKYANRSELLYLPIYSLVFAFGIGIRVGEQVIQVLPVELLPVLPVVSGELVVDLSSILIFDLFEVLRFMLFIPS